MAGFPGKRPIWSSRCGRSLAESDIQPRRFYGRRQTRPPKGERRGALESLLPRLEISLSARLSSLSPLFSEGSAFRKFHLEIGFGNGEHLAGLMERHPEEGFIGAEPFINGMSAFLRSVRDKPHDNVRVWMEDAIPLVDALPDRSLETIYILNPDPWPKKRHHKRRIVNQENLARFARILKPGGHLVMSTDVADLAEWIVTQASIHPAFVWSAEKADDWRIPPPDWIKTRYERRGIKEGRRQVYLLFKCS